MSATLADNSSASGTRLSWVDSSCRLLQVTRAEFADTQPFAGLTIGVSIHLEPKTAALIVTLQQGGAKIVATGNLNSTQPETAAYLKARGITIIGHQTKDATVHAAFLDQIIAGQPDLLLDNGGDLFTRYIDRPYDGLLGGTEETTSGRMRLAPLREQIQKPVLVINDSPIKQFAENHHAVGQSTVESIMRFTNRVTNGRRVTIIGYGSCGRGVAAHFRNAYSVVTVVDTDPVATLQAHLDGFLTPERPQAIASADVLITATGAQNVLTAADLAHLKDDVVLANIGHFPQEIDVAGIEASGQIEEVIAYDDEITTWLLKDKRRVHLLARGHMVNLAGPRPLGNSIESMDLGFTLQARCLEAVARRQVGPQHCVVPVPPGIDAKVATAYLDLVRAPL
ncbi:MAG: adenosylhomocysteinase [Anaerolineae bacterium]|nr:MAG: adenosylhomocysteinase [Anaerolineae bacterium]